MEPGVAVGVVLMGIIPVAFLVLALIHDACIQHTRDLLVADLHRLRTDMPILRAHLRRPRPGPRDLRHAQRLLREKLHRLARVRAIMSYVCDPTDDARRLHDDVHRDLAELKWCTLWACYTIPSRHHAVSRERVLSRCKSSRIAHPATPPHVAAPATPPPLLARGESSATTTGRSVSLP